MWVFLLFVSITFAVVLVAAVIVVFVVPIFMLVVAVVIVVKRANAYVLLEKPGKNDRKSRMHLGSRCIS